MVRSTKIWFSSDIYRSILRRGAAETQNDAYFLINYHHNIQINDLISRTSRSYKNFVFSNAETYQ